MQLVLLQGRPSAPAASPRRLRRSQTWHIKLARLPVLPPGRGTAASAAGSGAAGDLSAGNDLEDFIASVESTTADVTLNDTVSTAAEVAIAVAFVLLAGCCQFDSHLRAPLLSKGTSTKLSLLPH
jgi:hypothetical protein